MVGLNTYKTIKPSRILVIVNPVSGSGKGRRTCEKISKLIRKLSPGDIKVVSTEFPGHATELTRQAINNGTEKIIAAGGDGTLNEVVNGFFSGGKAININCGLGLIDCGTGSGLAGSLNLSASLEDQLDTALNGKPKLIDLGRLSFRNSDGEELHKYFISECQTGIGGKVAKQARSLLKRFGGRLGFGSSALYQALTIKSQNVSVKCDDSPAIYGPLIGLVIGNGTECAGGMKLLPDALIDDGRLDLLFMHDMKMAERLINLTKVYKGTHVQSPYFSTTRAKHISLESEHRWPIEVDGEVVAFTGDHSLDISVIPGAININLT